MIRRFVALVVFLVLQPGSVAWSAEPIQLEFGNWVPSTNNIAVNAFEPWKKLVEKETNGRVKVNLYHGGVLGTSKAVLSDIRGGVYHVGYMGTGYYYDTSLFKLIIGTLPFAISDPVVGGKVMSEFAEKYGKEIFDELGIKSMGILTTDAYVMFSRKPIHRLEELKNLKIRTTGKVDTQVVKNWGGVPISLATEDAYVALERGTLDVMMYIPGTAIPFRFHEVAPYVIRTDHGISVVGMIMNKAFFDKLPADLQKLFDEKLNPALINLMKNAFAKGADVAFEKMKAEFAAKGRGEIIFLSQEEKDRLIKLAEPEWVSWVNEANRRGYPGDRMMSDFKAILKKNGVRLPF